MNPVISPLAGFFDSLERTPGALVLRVIDSAGETRQLSFAQLFEQARRAGAGLLAHGARRGDAVVLALPSSAEVLALYFGSLLAGIVPILAPAPRGDRGFEHLDALVRATGAPAMVVPEGCSPRPGQLHAAELLDAPATGPVRELHGCDVAHLQATSGSTGAPRLAVVRHGNLAANVNAIGRRIRLADGDQLFIWLPLFHDMGLVAVGCTLAWQKPMTLTDPANFVRHPIRFWWSAMARFRASITAAPNSAYHACARLLRRRPVDGLDLSCVRLAFWGAEPILRDTVDAFVAAAAPHGFRPEAVLPVYGLAEATLAVSVPEAGAPLCWHSFDPAAVGPAPRATDGRSVAAIGHGAPIDGLQVRIVRDGVEVPEGAIGEIVVRGPSVTDAFWDARHGAPAARPPPPLHTGDLGYLRGGNLFVVGRSKDLIIVAGRNFVPAEIEERARAALDPDEVRTVVAVALQDRTSGTEAVHLLVEVRSQPPADPARAGDALRAALGSAFGLSGVAVHWIRKGGIPRTTSGKVQRFRCREIAAAAMDPARLEAVPAGRSS